MLNINCICKLFNTSNIWSADDKNNTVYKSFVIELTVNIFQSWIIMINVDDVEGIHGSL